MKRSKIHMYIQTDIHTYIYRFPEQIQQLTHPSFQIKRKNIYFKFIVSKFYKKVTAFYLFIQTCLQFTTRRLKHL